jgi:hypothetical protein
MENENEDRKPEQNRADCRDKQQRISLSNPNWKGEV